MGMWAIVTSPKGSNLKDCTGGQASGFVCALGYGWRLG